MTVTRTWTDPSEGGPMDRDTGQTIREQDYDAILSNLLVLGGTTGSEAAKYQLLTNGGFELWQRGNGPFTGQGTYGPDRWSNTLAAGDTMSVSRDAVNFDQGSVYCAAVTYTRSSGASHLLQQLADVYASLRGKTISFSVRVRTSTASAVRLRFNDGVSGIQYGAYHSGGGAYETITLTSAISPGATQLAVSVMFDQSCTAYLDNAMLVVGSVPAAYAPLHPADDLARCQRYYESSPATVLCGGSGLSTTAADAPYKYVAPKGGTPTITLAAASAFTLRVTGANVACTSIGSFFPGTATVLLNPSVASGLTAGSGVTLTATAGAVQVEWNP